MNEMFKKSESVSLLEGFTEDFPNWSLGEYFVELKPEARINVYCCKVASVEGLVSEWRQISSFIGAKTVTLPYSDFARWNCYLVYFCEEPVPRSIKYEIENDKFASRKMVEEGRKMMDEPTIAFLNCELLLTHVEPQPDSALQSRGPGEFSEFGQSMVTTGISAGNRNPIKLNRKAWLDAAVSAEVERLRNED